MNWVLLFWIVVLIVLFLVELVGFLLLEAHINRVEGIVLGRSAVDHAQRVTTVRCVLDAPENVPATPPRSRPRSQIDGTRVTCTPCDPARGTFGTMPCQARIGGITTYFLCDTDGVVTEDGSLLSRCSTEGAEFTDVLHQGARP